MPVIGILGFPSLVLVVCLIVPVIALVIRWKWRKAVSRTEEIKRLLVLASEEAARAELEASAGYGVVSVPSSYQCAVCYSPTTTRCAQCKTVRYCSGKCQIIHWRQGHKEECRPPSITDGTIDPGSDSGQKATQKEHYEINGDSFEIEGRPRLVIPNKTCSEEPALSDSGCSLDSLCEKVVEGIKPDLLADGKGTGYASESSGTSFSGFSDSATGIDVSDNVSVGESVSSNESVGSDGYLSVDNPLDMLETTFGVDQSKPLSPKFASLVNSVDSFTKLNKIKPGFSDGDSHCVSNSSSGLGTNGLREGSMAEPCTASSGFWRRSLDSVGSRNDARDNFSVSNSNGATDGKLSQSGSVLRFSFSLSESTSPPLHAQGAEGKGIVSDDALPDASATNKPIDAAALSENVSVDAPKVKKSAPLKCEGSSRTDNDGSSYCHKLKSREVRSMSSSYSHVRQSFSAGRDSVSTDALKVGDLPSSSSERLNHVVKDPGSTSHLLKSGEVGRLSSSAEGQSVPVAKSGKVNGVQDGAAISSQVTSCSPGARSGLKTVWKVVDQFRGSKLSKHYPSGDGCEVAGRYSDKGLFPYENFVKLYNWNKVELRPRGLINCGNSCYANAVLQCLAFTPPLTAYFLQRLHSNACRKKEWCFMCEFESLILKAKEGNSPLSPFGIVSQLRNIGSQLGNGREEDAHEFLRYAIDTMQSVCLTEAGINASGSLEEETTLIGLTFGGYLRSKIKCTKCNGKSERQERMMDLTVEIEGDIGTLEDALKRFTSTETLDGENKYRCGRCKSYEKAKKKLTIMEAPNILTIALKRFQSGKFGKLNKPIQFPEILDLAPFISGTSETSPIYRLYGVVVHLDIMNAAFSGHYVCYVKNIENKWFKIDDSTVTAVELGRVLTKGAYMLQYARCSPRAPRSIRNRIISPDLKNKATPSRINGKSTTLKSRSIPTHSSVAQNFPGSIPRDSPANIEAFYSGFHRLQRILEEDSSSDNSSLLSSNSDEGSCSTDSTRDSTSTDDLSDYIFGDSGHSWNSPYRNASDFDTFSSSSSSSSPSSSRHSPLNDLDRRASVYPETSGSPSGYADSAMEGDDPWDGSRGVDLEGKDNVPFLRPDTTRHYRRLVSSKCRETDSERLGPNPFHDVNSTFRKSMRERTD